MNMHEDEVKESVKEGYTKGFGISYLSKKYGVSRPTIYRWVEDAGIRRPDEIQHVYQDIGYENDGHEDQNSVGTIHDVLSELLSKADEILNGLEDVSNRLGRLEKKYL